MELSMRLYRSIFLLLILIPLVARGQKEGSIWYFGDGAGIDFSGGFPAVISGGAIRSFEGCASIADRRTGRLLFYTNGDSVWNSFGRLMPNGTGLYGHWSSTQSALIVPMPGDTKRYFIFTADAGSYVNPAGRGVYFSVVDMTADGGRGDVVQKNFRQLIVRASEKLVAVRTDGGRGYWVITSSSRDNGFYAFRVTDCGVSYQPVISNTGSFPDPPPQSIEIGYLKASPDGRRLAAASTATNVVQLFDFDIITGKVAVAATLPVTTPYGISFSPDSRKLYAASADMTHPGIYQYDLSAGSPASIVASAVKVPGGENTTAHALQLAPDGRIYVAAPQPAWTIAGMPKLGAIDNPDADISLCRYRPDAVDLRDGLCHLGLPNMIDSDTSLATVSRQVTICPGDTITLSASGGNRYAWSPMEGLQCPGCATTRALPRSTTDYVVSITEGNCTRYDTIHVIVRQPAIGAGRDISICRGDSVSLSAIGGVSYRWHPVSGLDCDSCASMLAHPDATTTYVVVGTTADGCRDSARVTVTVADTLLVDAGHDTTICAGEEIRLAGRGGTTFRWRPSAGLSCDSCADPLARPLHTTRYTLVSFNGPGCSSTDTVRITVDSVIADAGPDQTLCLGDTLQLAATATGSYSWERADNMSCTDCPNPRVWPGATTTYRLRVTGVRGCVATDSVTIVVLPPPIVDAGPGRTICRGQPVRLTATGGTSYHWSPATGLSCSDCDAPMAAPDATTLYTVEAIGANGCHGTDTVTVVVLDAPDAEAGDDVTICAGGNVRLHASGGERYRWSPPEGLNCTDCASPVASPAVTTTYHLVATVANGCTGIDSVRVTIVEPEQVALEIPRNLRVMPGSSLLVPVHLGSAVPIATDTVDISIAYNAGLLRSVGVDLAEGLLAGWRQEVVKDTAGWLSLRFISPGGLLRGPGMLLGLRFRAFLGDSLGCELPVTLGFGKGTCLLPSAVAGRVVLDSICGLSFRLIERSGSEYSLKQNSPNPFNPTTTIEFTLGLEGATTLEVLDAAGGRVGLLVDGVLGPGRYSVVWEGGSNPSGLYYCRLRSGAWSRVMQMLLVK